MVLGAVMGGAVVAVVMLMMAAHGVWIVRQLPGQQGGHCLVRVAGHAGVELDAGLSQGRAGAAANAATDKCVHMMGGQEPGQSTVAAAVGVHHAAGGDGAAVHLKELELTGMPEVLEHLAVFISNCENQKDTPPV